MKAKEIKINLSKSAGDLVLCIKGDFEYSKKKGVLEILAKDIGKYNMGMEMKDFKMSLPLNINPFVKKKEKEE